ncbi:gamma-glutamyl-gamma-aminobutyrate hydrolase family protein [archaeon AH-315-M20]|nr:gamma-glutamyl-gamma-aminobutyrate hydrolase family protein [archaeon AH-315-M20]
MRVFFIDNSGFTYNLIDEFEKRDCEVMSYRNNVDMKIIDTAIKKFKPNLIVISSGPGGVGDAGNSVAVIREHSEKIPIFGVGLGHECIIEALGGGVDRSPVVIHGKTSEINHDGKSIFKKMDNPFVAARYNSLSGMDIPYSLEVSARDENNIVMAVRHKDCFVQGVQFHPESILTPSGSLLIENVIKEASKK